MLAPGVSLNTCCMLRKCLLHACACACPEFSSGWSILCRDGAQATRQCTLACAPEATLLFKPPACCPALTAPADMEQRVKGCLDALAEKVSDRMDQSDIRHARLAMAHAELMEASVAEIRWAGPARCMGLGVVVETRCTCSRCIWCCTGCGCQAESCAAELRHLHLCCSSPGRYVP